MDYALKSKVNHGPVGAGHSTDTLHLFNTKTGEQYLIECLAFGQPLTVDALFHMIKIGTKLILTFKDMISAGSHGSTVGREVVSESAWGTW